MSILFLGGLQVHLVHSGATSLKGGLIAEPKAGRRDSHLPMLDEDVRFLNLPHILAQDNQAARAPEQ